MSAGMKSSMKRKHSTIYFCSTFRLFQLELCTALNTAFCVYLACSFLSISSTEVLEASKPTSPALNCVDERWNDIEHDEANLKTFDNLLLFNLQIVPIRTVYSAKRLSVSNAFHCFPGVQNSTWNASGWRQSLSTTSHPICSTQNSA
jgi:hypothetical protein